MNDVNCFLTLTYRDEHLPQDNSLDYSHFQRFMKRVRARFNVRVRFYMCGEYGELENRPHFHAILFGLDFLDKVHYRTLPSGYRLYRSPVLESLWPYGFSSIGSVTFQSAGYVARYCTKKVTGRLAVHHYTDPTTGVIRTSEFSHMSLKPGIGANWLSRFGLSDVDAQGRVVVNGVKANAPRYYAKLIEKYDPDVHRWNDVQTFRELDSVSRAGDNTYERLAVKEAVQEAAIRSLKRSI
jgi:hypothetical protein